MLKSITHTQQKLNVTFTIVQIEVGPKSDISKPMLVKLSRSELERQTPFTPNQLLNYSIDFIATFYVSKEGVKEKNLTMTLQIRGDNKSQSPVVINLAEYAQLKDVEQNFTRRILFNGAMYTAKCQVVMSSLGAGYTSFPSNPSAVPEISPRLPQHQPPSKPVAQPPVTVNAVKPKKEIRLTHSTSSLTTLAVTTPQVESIVSPRANRREMRSTNSTANLNVIRTPEARVGETRLGRSNGRSNLGSSRTKLAFSSPGQDSSISSQTHSPKLEENEINNEMSQLLRDIESFESIEMMEESIKTIEMPLLVEIIWNTANSNNLLNSNITVMYEIIRILKDKLTDDFIQMKSLAYLNSTLSWICLLLTKSLRNERNEKVNQLLDYCKICLIDSSTVLFDCIKKMICGTTNSWLEQQENSQVFIDGIDKIILNCFNAKFQKSYYENLIQDFIKLINSETTQCIITSPQTTEETGIYCQITVQLVNELFEKRKIKGELTIVKELSAVLVIQNKDILSTDASSEICPHLTSSILIQILNKLKEKNPQCISASTLTLLQRESMSTQYYDDTLLLIKKEKLSQVFNQSTNDSIPLLAVEELNKVFKERNYLKQNGLFDDKNTI